jgi:NIMA (never in mitosis gene a)-related kinase
MSDKADFAKLLLKHGYSGVKKIGEGSFGVAVLVQDCHGAQSVCKSVKVGAAAMEDLLSAKKEARLLAHLQHPHIVRYRTSFLDLGWFCIVMDFYDGGSLTDKIEKSAARSESIAEEQIIIWVTQMVLALEYLHDKGILHRDLKPSNLFLSKGGDLVVGDFGLSKVLDHTVACAKTLVGTPYYLSPEVIQDRPYFWPSDIWSVGCILFEVCALKVPFDGANLSQLAQKICFGTLPEIPARYSTALRELCYDLLCRQPEERPCASAILSRPFIQEIAQTVLSRAKEETDENIKAKHVVLEQFNRLDLNGDGVIDREELARMLKHLDSGVWTDELIDELLDAADVNKDSLIQVDEFVRWVFGEKDTSGLEARCKQDMEACLNCLEKVDLDTLKGSLLHWRQAVDLGCLSVLHPSACVETCDTLAALASEIGQLPNRCDSTEDRESKTETCFDLLGQMNAILYGVEQLLIDYDRQHVRRVMAVQSSSPSAVIGLCFELQNGTRHGQCPDGLGDASLKSGGGHWEVLSPGEQIVEVKGFAFVEPRKRADTVSSANANPNAAAPKPERKKFTLAKAVAKGKPKAAPSQCSDKSGSGETQRSQSDRIGVVGAAVASPTAGEQPIAATTESSEVGFTALAAALTLCTSRGRELKFGGDKTAVLGTPFAFKAPPGEELEDVLFQNYTCTGIRTAQSAPVLTTWDFWDKRKMEKVHVAFVKAATEICTPLAEWSWQRSERQGMFMSLQARRLGLSKVTIPDKVKERQHNYSMTMTPPSYWDMSGMKPSHGNTVGTVPVKPSEHKALQELLNATCCRGKPTEPSRQLVPKNFELLSGARIQNWQTWSDFQAQQEAIAKMLKEKKQNGDEMVTKVDGLKTDGFLEALQTPLDEAANTVWLFHGITPEAAELLGTADFDIDKAGHNVGSLYGRGVYLSETCNQADEGPSALDADDLQSMHALLICRVILGNVLLENTELPDVLRIVAQCVDDGTHHSVLGDRTKLNTGASRDFIVYNKDQVYPEFMLLYRRNYD